MLLNQYVEVGKDAGEGEKEKAFLLNLALAINPNLQKIIKKNLDEEKADAEKNARQEKIHHELEKKFKFARYVHSADRLEKELNELTSLPWLAELDFAEFDLEIFSANLKNLCKKRRLSKELSWFSHKK